MKPNPGGILQPNEILGRNAVIAELQSTLDQQSVLLVAERRTGKTHVLEKFKIDAPKSWVVIKRDIGAVRSALEFVQLVMADLYPHLEGKTNFRNWLQTLGEQIGGAQIGPVKLPNFAAKHWKQVLGDAVAHLAELETLERIVFLWDELPWMLEWIAKQNPAEAMELLDCLRTLRQSYPAKLRMVFTGSLGLHHIIRQLKLQGYNNTPVNDMMTIELDPLSQDDATDLARRLITDSKIKVADETVYRQLATGVDCMPFYIHHVVSSLLKNQHQTVDAHIIENVIKQGIHSDNNPWDLQHYEERTIAYYGTQREQSLALLDIVAATQTPMPMADIIKRGKAAFPAVSDQEWIELVRLLARDHYVKRNDHNDISFKFTVVKRWWIWQRNLLIEQLEAKA
jgi:uncharacterized protein